MVSRGWTCASCESFPRAALAADGVALCPVWEREVRWSDEACGPLYNRAKDADVARRLLVAKLMEVKPE